MPRLLLPFVVCCSVVMLSSCAGAALKERPSSFATEAWTPYKPRTEGLPFSILDYRNKDAGRPMPVWAAAWIEGGEQAMEQLPAYNNKYCFVMEQSLTNIDILLRWTSSFRTEKSFSQMALRRIFQKWTKGQTVSPDILYGSYFENMLKACAASFWPDAEAGETFWMLIRYNNVSPAVSDSLGLTPEADTAAPLPAQETYRALVFAVIDKTKFQNELNAIYDSIVFEKTDSRDQIIAVQRTINDFWQGF